MVHIYIFFPSVSAMKWFLLFVLAIGLDLSVANSISRYNHYRLPTALRPQRYYLRILTLLESPDDLRFAGNVQIVIKALQNTRNITLHSKNLTIDESRITLRQISGAGNMDNCVSSTSVNPTHDYYIFHTCKELLAGNVYKLFLPFSADLTPQLFGYYRSSYKDPVTNKTRWVKSIKFKLHLSNAQNLISAGCLRRNSNHPPLERHFPASMNPVLRHPLWSLWAITSSSMH